MPLRTIFRVPNEAVLGLGLMPAHRGGAEPVISLKEAIVVPGEFDPHRDPCPTTGRRGGSSARPERLAGRGKRTAAVSAVATKLLAGLTAGGDPRLRGAGPLARGRDAPYADAELRACEPDRRTARRSRSRRTSSRAPPSPRRSPAPTWSVHRGTGADRRARRPRAGRARQRGRLVPRGPASSKRMSSRAASLFVDRRESTVNAGPVPRSRRRARHRSRAHPRGARRAVRRRPVPAAAPTRS